jgi:hypothetical protein
LAAAKKRGVKLGGDRGMVPSAKLRKLATKAIQARAAARAADIAPAIKALQASGVESLRALARGLNAQDIPTSRGEGEWSAAQVARVLKRLKGLAGRTVL